MKNAFEEAINRLELEYEGFRKLVWRYTHEALITNYFSKLKSAIDEKNISNIKYCLAEIEKWYRNYISEIQRVDKFNYLSHFEAMNKIIELNKCIQIIPEDFVLKAKSDIDQNQIVNKHTSSIIFISHSSADKKYGDALRNFIIGLGVKNKQLVYTSHPLHKIPAGQNIYNYLRSRINNQTFMLFLFSNNYLDSTACLNEMGAAWLAQTEYLNFYVPNFDFGDNKYLNCAIDKNQMGIKLENNDILRVSMIEFKNKLVELFKINPDEATVSSLIDNFINEIK